LAAVPCGFIERLSVAGGGAAGARAASGVLVNGVLPFGFFEKSGMTGLRFMGQLAVIARGERYPISVARVVACF
jgi:hypothetical protein